jgi:hypothetical protein
LGINDSTKTRVTPVFNKLSGLDPSGGKWLTRLLSLPSRGTADWVRPKCDEISVLETVGWGTAERRLSPPRDLLRWLLCNAKPQSPKCWNSSRLTVERRRALLDDRDPVILAEAMRELERPILSEGRWFIFEGLSSPDVFLQTSKYIFVIEGKRTERGPTTKTDWMAPRLQMLRHMDSAFEIADGRMVFGFFIVEGRPPDKLLVPAVWREAAKVTVSTDMLVASLPHRTEAQRKQIADGFLGVATWQQVCKEFDISFPPDKSDVSAT